LVNNAGVWFEGPTDEHPDEKIREVFEVNIMGMVYCTKAVLPVMKKRNEGQILNIMSSAALHPDGGWGVYTASKYAGKGYTESLREELKGTGIKVMAFYPGGMDTNLFYDAGFHKKSEPWMMKLDDVTEVLKFMLTRPGDVCVESLSLRKFSK
jgi:short-subunit dehydrogenase